MIDENLRLRRREIALEHMTAENAHEFGKCIDVFDHPRYEIVATGEVYDGPSEVAKLLDENERAFPDFHFDVSRIRDAENAVVAEGNFRGTHLGTWRGLPPTGRSIDFPLIIVFEFEEDRMVCERTYFDIGTPLRQLGVARDPNSKAGQLATMLNHPFTVGRALLGELERRRASAPDLVDYKVDRDQRPRAKVGGEIRNDVSGERLVFFQTHESSGGTLFQAEISMPKSNFVIQPHIHIFQEERFEVVSGKCAVRVGDAIQYIGPGEDIVIPIRTDHSYWNAGRGELRILYEHRPALVSAEVFLQTYYGLSRVGKVSPAGKMGLLQAAVLIDDVKDFIRPPSPPVFLQDPLFAALAAMGRMLGYRPWYPEFIVG